MPALRPIVVEPRTTYEVEEAQILALREMEKEELSPRTNRPAAAAGNPSLTGRKVGASLRGGAFSPGQSPAGGNFR